MLKILDKLLSQYFTLLIPISITIGVLNSDLLAPLHPLVPWLFGAMTFFSTLQCTFKDFPRFLRNPGPVLAGLGVIHIIGPIIASLLATVTMGLDTHLGQGIVLENLVPMGVTAVVWAAISRGDVPLALSTAAVDTVVTPILLPLTALLIMGKSISINPLNLFLDLSYILLIPSLLALTLNHLSQERLVAKTILVRSLITKSGLCLVVAISVGKAWPTLQSINANYLLLLVSMALLSAAGYFSGYLVGQLGKWSEPTQRTLVFIGGMRNTVLGTVLALEYFHPITSVPVVLTMLFQQPFAGISLRILDRKKILQGSSSKTLELR